MIGYLTQKARLYWKHIFLFFSILICVLGGFVIYYVNSFDYNFYANEGPASFSLDPSENISQAPAEGFLVWSPSCRIPDLDPWHESIRRLIHRTELPVCSDLPPLSRIDGKTLYLIEENMHLYNSEGRLNCCYQDVTRHKSQEFDKSVDDQFDLSECHPLQHSVELLPEQQFLLVKCRMPDGKTVYHNFHVVLTIPRKFHKKLEKSKRKEGKNMSVLIVGIDSISRLNLIRTMPQTRDFLLNSGWIELKGYNKIASNTLPNIMAILTGLDIDYLEKVYVKSNKDPIDNCPFIWKNFSHENYITAYGEDNAHMAIFNYAWPGFFQPPTDYYLKPIFSAAEHEIKNKTKLNGLIECLGPTNYVEPIYQYIKEFAIKFLENLYFAFFWMNSMSHDDVNRPTAIDSHTLQLFKDLSENGVLNNTFVLFLSDHGMRYGDIRNSYIGWFEERLPFLFIWLPKWYREQYPHKFSNLIYNTNKLTTPYDVHLTLQDILYNKPKYPSQSCPKCVTLFHPVPWNRTCLDAGLTEQWCACTAYRPLQNQGHSVKAIVHFTIKEINILIENVEGLTVNNTRCAELSVNRVLSARTKIDDNNQYIVSFETTPGQAMFEALVRRQADTFTLVGAVSRINKYGNQSKCINDAFLKNYCFCINSDS